MLNDDGTLSYPTYAAQSWVGLKVRHYPLQVVNVLNDVGTISYLSGMSALDMGRNHHKLPHNRTPQGVTSSIEPIEEEWENNAYRPITKEKNCLSRKLGNGRSETVIQSLVYIGDK